MSQRRAPHVRVSPPAVVLVAVLVGLALQRYAFPLPVGPLTADVRLGAGAISGLIGLSMILLAFVHFWRTGQNPTPWTHSPELIREGIYRYSRNPMYVGLAFIQVGVGLGLDNLWVIVMVFPALVVIDRTAVRPEEVYLDRKFQGRYRRYRDTVRRWL
jgi:protein-S-isoprenylcysteine O-methyltransferase Ste14